MPLHEKYRPKTWAEVIGQEKVIAQVERLRPRGLGGRAYWITGNSGTGKTTIARLLADELCDKFGWEEFDATGLSASAISDIERNLSGRGVTGEKRGRAAIINEAHGLNKTAVRQLLTTLERIPPHVVWIFTTTTDGDAEMEGIADKAPLMSRMIELPLAKLKLAQAFAKRAKEIAVAEGLDGKPDSSYLKLAEKCCNNFRMMLNQIEAGNMQE